MHTQFLDLLNRNFLFTPELKMQKKIVYRLYYYQPGCIVWLMHIVSTRHLSPGLFLVLIAAHQ